MTPASADPLAFLEEPLLRAEEEVELAKAIEAGLYARELLRTDIADPALRRDLRQLERIGAEAFHRFVRANVRLAAWLARRRAAVRATGTLSYEDLVSEGVLGIIRAVQKWDYRRGLKFSTYAISWVRQFQQRAILRAAPATLTFSEHEDCRRMLAEQDRLIETLHRMPTRAELADALRSTVRRIDQIQAMLQHPVSLDQPVSDRTERNATSLGDLIPAAAPDVDDNAPDAGAVVGTLLTELSSRERSVVAALFGLDDGQPRTVAEVAAARRVPAALVAAAAESAMRKLRCAAAEQEAA